MTKILQFATTKNGKRALMVRAGTVAVGDVIEHTYVAEHVEFPGTAIPDGYVQTDRRDGYGRTIWIREQRRQFHVTGLGKEFTTRGYYIDEEDSRSFRADGRATHVASMTVQYAYYEELQ